MHGKRLWLPLLIGLLLLSACTPQEPPESPLPPSPTQSPTPEKSPTFTEELATPTSSPTATEIPPTATPTAVPVTLLGVEPDQLQGVTIQFWHSFSGARERLLTEWVDSFNSANTFGITVELANQQNLFSSVQEAIRAGMPPNVTISFTNQAASWDQSSAPPGDALVDLTPYLTDPVYGYAPDELADFYAPFLQQEIVEGKMIGFPTYRSVQVMFYNTTWAQELGFQSPPATPEEFKQQACASSQARGDGTGGWFINTDTATTLSWFFAFGGDVYGPESEYQFNTPENEAAFRFLKELQAEGCAWQPEPTFPNLEFANRQGLFYSSNLGGLFFQANAFQDAENSDDWTMISFPSVTGEPVPHTFGVAYNVFKTTPEEQLAGWLFIQWVSSPANQARWTEISGSYPTRISTLEYLNQYVARTRQWTRAYDLVPIGKYEPTLPSWGIVRWVVSDAAAELFKPGFTSERIPALLEELDQTASEVGGP